MKSLILIFHGRFPSEKAAAIFLAENARSLAQYYDITILVPRRLGMHTRSVHQTYNLSDSIQVRYLPTIDLFWLPYLSIPAFYISMAVFALMTTIYLFSHTKSIVLSNEPLPTLLASYIVPTTTFEVHDFPEKKYAFYRLLFKRVRLILATNAWKESALEQEFSLSPKKILMERNGVDLSIFSSDLSKVAARASLGLPEKTHIGIYTGQLYGWKGVDVIVRAARLLPDTKFYCIGGSKESHDLFIREHGTAPNLYLVENIPHDHVKEWQAAADFLILPNTARDPLSVRYTSPMKLFEYMASGRPILASRLPSIEEILDDMSAFFFVPDDERSFAESVQLLVRSSDESMKRSSAAREKVQQYAWPERAKRLVAAMENISNTGRNG